MTILLVLAVFCLAGAAFLVGELVMLPARQRSLSVRRAATYGRMEIPTGTPQEGLRERVLAPVGEWLAKWALKVNPRSTKDGVAMRILAAGLGRRISPTNFRAIKGFFALVGIFFGSLLGSGRGLGGLLMGAMFVGAMGFLGPDYYLTLKARGRKERLAPGHSRVRCAGLRVDIGQRELDARDQVRVGRKLPGGLEELASLREASGSESLHRLAV